MKEALKEYYELVALSGKWARKHWKGLTMFYAAYAAALYGWWYYDDIKAYVKSKFIREEEKP